jgi:hypothetical protein
MLQRLGEDDALAIDPLLDRSMSSNANQAGTFVSPVSDAVIARVGAAESILRLIAQMPASDPPAGLVQRTLDRIKQRTAPVNQPVDADRQQPDLGQGRQHA